MDVLDNHKVNNHVLIFDTDSVALNLMSDMIRDMGLNAIPVDDAKIALEGLEADTPALIIADVNNPGVTAFGVLNAVRRSKCLCPVIVTGIPSGIVVLQAFRNGAVDYLSKPLDPAQFRERVAVALSTGKSSGTVTEAGTEAVQKLLDAVERDNKELTNLLKISSSLNTGGDSKQILSRLTELAAESMNCEVASIMLINERGRVLEFVVATGDKKNRLETISVPLGEGIAGWVALHGEPQIVNDTKTDSRFTGKVDDESGFETRQILATPLRLDSQIIGVLEVINTIDDRILTDDDLRVLNAIGDRAATVIEATRTIETQQNFFVQNINIIVKALEKKELYAEGHPWKVAELSHRIACEMDMSETEKDDLNYGALLHDIGKLNMPSTIFIKRTLSERELEFIRQHPVMGAKLLNPITMWNALVPFVLYHHENWDGSGYPFGRSGTDIPLEARIINIAEAYSVMRSPNSYKKQVSTKEAILEVMRFSGRQFDPAIVKIFIGVLEEDPSIR